MMKVTLGLCIKNNSKTLVKTIDSIVNQDYPREKFELIVVNGLSRDKSVEIVHNRLSMKDTDNLNWSLWNDEGRGLAYARQMVVDKSSAPYILWVDGDHILPPEFVSKQVAFMEVHPDVGAAEAITLPAESLGWVGRLEGLTWKLYSQRRVGIDLESVGSAGGIYRRKAIVDVKGYDLNIKKAGEDGDLTRRMRVAGWKLRINPWAYYYHICRDSIYELMSEYYWWGYGAHYVGHKHHGSVNPGRFLLAPFSGIKHGIRAFIITRDSVCFFIPIHYTLKRIGWLLGYFNAHLDGYQLRAVQR
jgi:glycosyltransferase involved in cell wall biosynthesis